MQLTRNDAAGWQWIPRVGDVVQIKRPRGENKRVTYVVAVKGIGVWFQNRASTKIASRWHARRLAVRPLSPTIRLMRQRLEEYKRAISTV